MARKRIELPLEQWPELDRRAWDALFREGDILDGCGEAWHWAPATRKTNRKHYARWLGWLAETGQLGPDDPAARATPERIERYARALDARLAPRTVASALIGLKCVLKKMQPAADWRWLMDYTNRLDSWAAPSRDRQPRMLPAETLFRGALEELARLTKADLDAISVQLAYRDVLMVALLVSCPVRVKNLAQIRLGEHLQKVGPDWWLRFSARETKTREAVSHLLPVPLVPWLSFYLEQVRSKLREPSDPKALWPGRKGRGLAPITIYVNIMRATERLFGVGIDPHTFRAITATALALESPEDAGHARALLGHRRADTTERFYIRTSQSEASRNMAQLLRDVRDGGSATEARPRLSPHGKL